MAKKKSDKETEPKKVSTKRFSAFFKNETTHFVIGLISVIFAVYLLLAFTSFFFTGAADQSIDIIERFFNRLRICQRQVKTLYRYY